MKIVLAPDKFKNALNGIAFCDAVTAGIREVIPHCDIIKLPLADGGDGTIEVINFYLKGHFVAAKVSNPFFEPIKASYLYAETSQTAFIEMAEASGVKLLQPDALDCKKATTLGTGELIIDAVKKGAKTIILGIGGSATNDCGIGMASALGYRFLDKNNNEVKPIGANLSCITSIDTSHVNSKLKAVNFKIACDVSNPLYGNNGAAYVYAKQKGANAEAIALLDKGLRDFAQVIADKFGVNPQLIAGAGAAGGMGIASKVFLNGTLEKGIDLIKDIAQFDLNLSDTDWIITGEGKLDNQTFSGKTIQGVVSSAKAKHIKVAAFCGAFDLEGHEPKEFGIDYTDAVMNYAKHLDDAMKNSTDYVKEMAKQFAKTHLI